jgi:hypothetical protein
MIIQEMVVIHPVGQEILCSYITPNFTVISIKKIILVVIIQNVTNSTVISPLVFIQSQFSVYIAPQPFGPWQLFYFLTFTQSV